MLTPALTISLAFVASEPVLEATLTPDLGREVPGFGGVLAYADPWLVVGWDDPGGKFDVLLPARPVHVFRRDGTAWELDAVIETESAGCYEIAVATDGARIAIGLPEGRDRQEARVLVLARGGDAWQVEAELPSPDACVRDLEEDTDDFGVAVALRGKRLFVGAPWCAAGDQAGGNVFAYELQDGRWRNRHRLDGEWDPAYFGEALAVSESALVVANPASLWGGAGTCTVFDLRGTNPSGGWILSHPRLPGEPPDGSTIDGWYGGFYAHSVAAQGGTVAVSDSLVGEHPRPCGAVHVHEINNEVCPQYQRVANPTAGSSVFGRPVALGSRFLVATWHSGPTDRVYAFERDATGTFVPTCELEAPPDDVAAFGHALATQGPRIVVGAPSEARRSGRVLVYRID